MKNIRLIVSGLMMASLVACSASDDGDLNDPNGPGGKNGNGASSGGANGTSGGASSGGTGVQTTTCRDKMAENKVAGLGGTDLVAGINEKSRRPDGAELNGAVVTLDRFRLKPFTSLEAEFVRIIGNQSDMVNLIRNSRDAFGAAPNRWFMEPQAGATTLFTAYRAAFKGCLQYANNYAPFQAAPTADSAKAECAKLEAKAWSRIPTAQEIDLCASIATDSAAFAAAVPAVTDPKAKWAYACALVLDTAQFLSY